jgi:hypothetical protein
MLWHLTYRRLPDFTRCRMQHLCQASVRLLCSSALRLGFRLLRCRRLAARLCCGCQIDQAQLQRFGMGCAKCSTHRLAADSLADCCLHTGVATVMRTVFRQCAWCSIMKNRDAQVLRRSSKLKSLESQWHLRLPHQLLASRLCCSQPHVKHDLQARLHPATVRIDVNRPVHAAATTAAAAAADALQGNEAQWQPYCLCSVAPEGLPGAKP